ncbi:MAG TPA: hypothetical protein VNO30_37995 [Kofleriaceae bacterium]|nr:hypothetical protein [Kofleriaceae bacterium]
MVEGFAIEPELVRPITRSEYDQMVALGLFADERVELFRGTLVKLHRSSRHTPLPVHTIDV